MIPLMAASGLLTAGLGIGKAIMKKNLAKDQMARSQDLRTQGLAVKKPALRPEFARALQGSKLRTLTGLPNEQMIKDEVDLENATSFGRGQNVASSGGELLQYAASLGAQGNALKRGISTESANMRNQNYGNYLNTLWNVGGQELNNVAIQRMERDKFLDQSSALENAATANKFQGKQEILGAIGEGIGGGLGAIASSKMDNSGYRLSESEKMTRAEPSRIPEAPIGGIRPAIDSRSLLDASSPLANLLPAEKAEIQKILADNPDMDVEEAVQLYRNLRKGL